MVEGYETEEQVERRLAREKAEAEATERRRKADTAAQLPVATREAFGRLRGTPHDCMIEVIRTTFWSERAIVRRVIPGWDIGAVLIRGSLHEYGHPVFGGFAISETGELYLGSSLRGRKAFRSHGPPKEFGSWFQELLDLLDRAGR